MKIKFRFKYIIGMVIVLLLGVTCLNACAEETNEPAQGVPLDLPFPVGEMLVYRMYWGIIPIGLSITRSEWIEENGRKLIAIRYRSYTNRIFDTIYPVNDTAESIVDPQSFLPVRFSFSLTRRRSKIEKIVTFDHSRLKASTLTTKTGQIKEFDIEPDTRDIISFLFHCRYSGFEPYRERKVRIVAESGMLDMKLKTEGYEDVKLNPFGAVPCLKLEPIAKLDQLLVEDGTVMSWIARERCLATKMTIKAPVADVSIELAEVRGPGNDFWTQTMRKHDPDYDKEPEKHMEKR